VIETDRHSGSIALNAWLDAQSRGPWAAVYEVTDLPVPAPRIYRAAAGLIVMSIVVRADADVVEDTFAGVLPDVGHQLAEALGSIKSRESEVLIPGFYDGIDTPAPGDMAAIQDVSDAIGAWIGRSHPLDAGGLSAAHLTLGTFCVPSIMVRELSMRDAQPFMPAKARATIEVRLMPGQDVSAISRSVATHVRERILNAQVEVLLARAPGRGWGRSAPDLSYIAPELPLTPSDSPAGILEASGIPTIGFATVWRNSDTVQESASIEEILRGASMAEALCHASSQALAHPVR
jgi:acetylornithine deacetylase/succinyl-diaminopimelate desuccinylase-like protein